MADPGTEAMVCQSKVRYADKPAALKAMRFMSIKRPKGTPKPRKGLGLMTYRCRHCDGVHIGNAQ